MQGVEEDFFSLDPFVGRLKKILSTLASELPSIGHTFTNLREEGLVAHASTRFGD